MFRQMWFRFPNKPSPDVQTIVLYCLLCILPLVHPFFITTPALAASAGWAATYGEDSGDLAFSIQQTSDGGYIVAGGTSSFGVGDIDICLLKLEPDGTVEWQKTYGGIGDDRAESVWQTSDGGYIAAGLTSSFGAGDYDFWILRLRPNGAVEWQKTYGGVDHDWAFSIQQTSDGGYIAAGRTKSFGSGDLDLWVLKLSPNGSIEWQKTYGGASDDEAYSVQQTGDSGYVVAGFSSSFGAGGDDFWVLRLRPDGSIEWQKTYGGELYEWAHSIQQTSDGGYVVAGETNSAGVGRLDAWVLKLSPDGTVEWQKTYGGVDHDQAEAIQQTSDGGYIVACWTQSFGAGIDDFWVLRLRLDGSIEWQKTYGGELYEWAYSIRQTSDGGYIVAGETISFGNEAQEIWVLKLRPDGSINPSCYSIITLDTSVSGKDSSATIKTTSADAIDSNINPQDSSAIVQDTNVSANILCP